MDKISLTVSQEFDSQRISDLLCNAIEGGSNYWMRIVESSKGHTDVKYPSDYPMSGGNLVFEIHGDGNERPFPRARLDRERMILGLQKMAKKYPLHWSNFITENDDAETGDVFLQCCLFGEIVYG